MDAYFKKEITYPYKGIKFVFDVGITLFSTFAIDHGTDMLIRHMTLNNPKTILDIGCGYGPIGIILAKTNPQAQVIMADADLLAVKYTKINIQKNNVTNAIAVGSVGMEQVLDKHFDLIVSNVPAKIGDNAITQEFILTPYAHLNPGGELWIVVVSALNHLIPRVGIKNHLDMKMIRKRSGHSLYRIKKLID
ncbi:MAG TPA: methyltransferase [Patescibacteria group bacterium]|jgi:16S rRNA G1207 methylase RsmC|nr:methyltransferase [Patescibacteria group bacterium]